MNLIKVSPAPGMRIIDPFTGIELRPGVMPDNPFWRRRAAEGGVIIESADPPKPVAAPAKPFIASKIAPKE